MALDDKKDTGMETQSFVLEEPSLQKTHWASSPLHLQQYMKAGLNQQDAQFLHDVPKEEQNKIFNKVDWRLCPMLAVLYLISHLDRRVLRLHAITSCLLIVDQGEYWVRCFLTRDVNKPAKLTSSRLDSGKQTALWDVTSCTDLHVVCLPPSSRLEVSLAGLLTYLFLTGEKESIIRY